MTRQHLLHDCDSSDITQTIHHTSKQHHTADCRNVMQKWYQPGGNGLHNEKDQPYHAPVRYLSQHSSTRCSHHSPHRKSSQDQAIFIRTNLEHIMNKGW